MADEDDSSDKTEDPTQKRLDEALERGDVAKSQEVNTWFMIAGATLVLSSFSGSIGSIQMPLRNLLANAALFHTDGPSLLELARKLEYVLIAALGVPLLMLAISAREAIRDAVAAFGKAGGAVALPSPATHEAIFHAVRARLKR